MTPILAQNLKFPGPNGQISLKGPDNFLFTNIAGIIGGAIKFIFIFAGIGLLAMLVFAGYDFLTSAGDAKKLETGKQRMTNALIGFVLIFAAYWVVQIAGKIFGLSIIDTVFK
ncbi:hypothetical protein HY947_06675 [Candidatus Gottesmanbacteria bacterium]|nr:hypothetical protein [Candidatus Gottesmanbacteria bacterium]